MIMPVTWFCKPVTCVLLFHCVILQAADEAPRPKLQLINGSNQVVDVFWLKNKTERIPNGSVKPGMDKIITTTLGHQFLIVGREDKSEI